ncbi:hypothetical protein VNO80_09690 [Phaseolus coccineus]|uniref:Uncharacterized protein n=1 Tax=Phaseolus coccineus TaxID=3886 RepID=A0AAN9NBZ6_PHACN
MISSAFVPIPNPDTASFFMPHLNKDVVLKCNEPTSGDCAGHGQVCGFTADTKTLQVGCFFYAPNQNQEDTALQPESEAVLLYCVARHEK